MARREMHWYRYLCEGRKRSGSYCEGLILICDVDGAMADVKAQDEYGWRKRPKDPCTCDCHDRHGHDQHCPQCASVHDGTTGEYSWLCDLTHQEDS